MAYAIMGGLAVATILTLVFLPALYVIWFRVREPAPDTGERYGSGELTSDARTPVQIG